MMGLKHAVLFGLNLALLAVSQAHGVETFSKRGLPTISGDVRVPKEISLDGTKWTRPEILKAIKQEWPNRKHFVNHGVEFDKGKWVPAKGPLFKGPGTSGQLWEVDLIKSTNRGKFRAILSGNKVFVGITSHEQANNVKSFFDVNKRNQEGFYLNGGSVPETLAAGSEQFKRQSIAEAMDKGAGRAKYDTVKGPDFPGFDRKKTWIAKVNKANGGPSQNVRVVYSGDKFLGLIDVTKPDFCVCPGKGKGASTSGQKLRRRLRRVKRQGGVCACAGLEEAEGNKGSQEEGGKTPAAEEKPKALAGEENPQVPAGEEKPQGPPGEEEGPKGPAAGEEKPKAPAGEENPQVPAGEENPRVPPGDESPEGPATGKEKPVTQDSAKTAKLANEISEREFSEAAARRGLDKLAQEKWRKSLSEVRELVGFKTLQPSSPKLATTGLKLTAKGASVAGGVLWAVNVADVFSHDTSAWDRTEAVTAMLPFVGCTTHAAAEVAQGKLDDTTVLDSTLCFMGDGLLLTPAWPVGLLLHLVRALVSLFKAPDVPELDAFKQSRDSTWAQFLDDKVYGFLYSHPHVYKTGGFAPQLETAMAVEELAVLSSSAETIGAAEAVGQDLLASSDEAQKQQVESDIQQAVNRTRQATEQEIARRQRDVLVKMPQALQAGTDLSFQPVADSFNQNFTASITSNAMVGKYRHIYIGDPEVPDTQRDNSDEVRQKLSGIADSLRKDPPRMPGLFEIAYVLGQSKGLAKLNQGTLSAQGYIETRIPHDQVNLTQHKIDFLALRHTLGVARLIRGSLEESKLPTDFITEDAQQVKELQLLIALKYGRLYETWKAKKIDDVYQPFDKQSPHVVDFITHPDKIPSSSDTEGLMLMGLILGLQESLVDTMAQAIRRETVFTNTATVIFDALIRKAEELGTKVGHLDLKQFVREAQEKGRQADKKKAGQGQSI